MLLLVRTNISKADKATHSNTEKEGIVIRLPDILDLISGDILILMSHNDIVLIKGSKIKMLDIK